MTGDSFAIICNRCRAEVPSTAETCPQCGNVLIGTPERPRPVRPPTPINPAAALPPELAEVPRRADLPEERRHLLMDPAPSMTPSSYGGFWIRVVATLIDSVVILVATLVFAFMDQEVIAGVIYAAGFLLYYPLMEGSSAQGTVGKLLCGLAVTDTSGRRISYWRAYGRQLGRLLCSLTGGLGYLLVAFTSRKQGLHDLVAGTLVLHRGLY